jgi:glucan phosphoethanolaminetransferase (alkaline phosphatase superfamily)
MMVKKILPHLIVAFSFFLLTLLQQYLFYYIKNLPIIWFSLEKYFITFLFFLVFTFSKGNKIRFFFLSGLMLLNFFQMAHLSYFGTQILPNEIYLLFTQMHEITGVINNEMGHILIPLLFTVVPVLAGLWVYRKVPSPFHYKTVSALIFCYLIYNPARTFITGNTWGRQPSTQELSGMNVYLSTSYFLGRILPHKLLQNKQITTQNSSLKLQINGMKDSNWDHIIVVQGESLTPHQMSLFGYQRPTTTFLESLKVNPHFFFSSGLSAGVSTDVSVAFFINLGFGDAGAIKIAKGEHCLFKSAKLSGFSTHFLSTQSAQQLRYIAPYLCSAYLDDLRSLESVAPHTPDANAAVDRDMLPKIRELLDAKKKNFIMLHQRGSHGPWALRSTKESRIFTSSEVDERINDYDNSVVEFDLFWRDLNQLLLKRRDKTLVIYVSDHGEYVGHEGRWGHGFLAPKSFEIPVLIQSFGAPLPAKTKQLPPFLTHYNVGLYISEQIGRTLNQDSLNVINDYEIYGNDIDGLAGKAKIIFGQDNTYHMAVEP